MSISKPTLDQINKKFVKPVDISAIQTEVENSKAKTEETLNKVNETFGQQFSIYELYTFLDPENNKHSSYADVAVIVRNVEEFRKAIEDLTGKKYLKPETFATPEQISAFFVTGHEFKPVNSDKYERIYVWDNFLKNLPMVAGKEALNLKRRTAETKRGLNTDLQIFEAEVKEGRMTQEEFDTFKKENKLPERYYTDTGAIKTRLEAGEYSKSKYYVEYVKNEQGTAFAVVLGWGVGVDRWARWRVGVPCVWGDGNSVFLSN